MFAECCQSTCCEGEPAPVAVVQQQPAPGSRLVSGVVATQGEARILEPLVQVTSSSFFSAAYDMLFPSPRGGTANACDRSICPYRGRSLRTAVSGLMLACLLCVYESCRQDTSFCFISGASRSHRIVVIEQSSAESRGFFLCRFFCPCVYYPRAHRKAHADVLVYAFLFTGARGGSTERGDPRTRHRSSSGPVCRPDCRSPPACRPREGYPCGQASHPRAHQARPQTRLPAENH